MTATTDLLAQVDRIQKRLGEQARILAFVEHSCIVTSDSSGTDAQTQTLLEGIAVIAGRASKELDGLYQQVDDLWAGMRAGQTDAAGGDAVTT